MKALVIGYGSAGKHHIRNISTLDDVEITVCTNRKSDAFLKKRKCRVINNLDDCFSTNYDFAIIANNTNLHVKTALVLAKKKIPFILEKPLSHNIAHVKNLISLIKKNNLITMMGCNLRFHPCIAKIKELLMAKRIGKIISVQVENGSYLPDWHPYENYKKSYASRKELGGGVVLTSIHEIDYLYWFFGNPKEVSSITGKFSNLEINTDDLSSSMLLFKNKILSEIHLDFFQYYPFRSCKIIGDRGIIYWDSKVNSVKIFDAKNRKWKNEISLKNFDINFTYAEELKHFIYCLKNHKQTINSIEDGEKTLKIALAILRSSKLKKMIKL